MALGQALNVGFVDDRAVPGGVEGAIALPVKGGVDDNRLGHKRGAIDLREGQVEVFEIVGGTHVVAKNSRIKLDIAV